MGLFNNKELEELSAQLQTLTGELTETKKAVSREIAKNHDLRQELNERAQQIKHLNAKLDEAKPIAPPDTQFARLMQFVGGFFLLVSLVIAYVLMIKDIFPVDLAIVWGAYVTTQLLGLYLLGYGKKVTFGALQRFGAYMSLLFLLICAYMTLLLAGIINLKIGPNLIGLGAINAVGIIVLIYAEREAVRLHHRSI